jgi:serine/threonine-protein kinase RsbW
MTDSHSIPARRGPTEPQRVSHMRVSLEIVMPSDVRCIESAVGLVTHQCEELAFAPHHCSLNVPVALSEALSNAILRGNGESANKRVRVRSSADHVRLVLEVIDEGAGFDLERCTRDPTRPENLLREDGRGLYLMRQLMDRVERFNNGGNVVRLTLHRV